LGVAKLGKEASEAINPIPINVGVVLAIAFWYRARIDMATGAFTIARDTDNPLPRARRQPRRFWSHAVLFTACVILVNSLVGDKGLMDTIHARRMMVAAAQDLARLKHENASLREQVRRLRSDPSTIESVARGELGLVRPGEILVTIKDVR
jgi:cell division protein FtsB